MIRVELLHGQRRQLPPWAGPALFALVICGGLYGLNWLYPFGQLFNSSTDAPVVWQEQQGGAVDPPAASQDEATDLWATETTTASWETAAESSQVPGESSDGWDEAPQQELAPMQEPPPVMAQELPPVSASASTAIKPATPAPMVTTSPTPAPIAITGPAAIAAPDGERSGTMRHPPRRSAACQWAVRINERVPAGVRLVSLTCSAAGEYGLEGTSVSQQALHTFNDLLQQLPSQVTLSSWQEGKAQAKVLRFAFDGRFAQQPVRELATLSSDQANRLFGKVAAWADESGLDGLAIKKPISMPLPPARIHQRQKLWGTGSYQQIGAFLQKLQQVEETAVLGEVVLMPVQGGAHGWVEARLYAAVDIVVGMP